MSSRTSCEYRGAARAGIGTAVSLPCALSPAWGCDQLLSPQVERGLALPGGDEAGDLDQHIGRQLRLRRGVLQQHQRAGQGLHPTPAGQGPQVSGREQTGINHGRGWSPGAGSPTPALLLSTLGFLSEPAVLPDATSGCPCWAGLKSHLFPHSSPFALCFLLVVGFTVSSPCQRGVDFARIVVSLGAPGGCSSLGGNWAHKKW